MQSVLLAAALAIERRSMGMVAIGVGEVIIFASRVCVSQRH